jgi:hypothetical protein
MSVAKLSLGDFHKEQRQRHRADGGWRRKITFGEALATYQQKLQNAPNIKSKMKEYHEFHIKAFLKSWPELKDISPQDFVPIGLEN